jgi:hypothetical protein
MMERYDSGFRLAHRIRKFEHLKGHTTRQC